MTAQYVIGIDLGTTNSVLAYADLADDAAQVQLLPIPQLVAAQTVESRPSLPSFLYLAADHEVQNGLFRLPWDQSGRVAVGTAARSLAAEFPERTVSAPNPGSATRESTEDSRSCRGSPRKLFPESHLSLPPDRSSNTCSQPGSRPSPMLPFSSSRSC